MKTNSKTIVKLLTVVTLIFTMLAFTGCGMFASDEEKFMQAKNEYMQIVNERNSKIKKLETEMLDKRGWDYNVLDVKIKYLKEEEKLYKEYLPKMKEKYAEAQKLSNANDKTKLEFNRIHISIRPIAAEEALTRYAKRIEDAKTSEKYLQHLRKK